jgi:DNA-binding transcriptional LysR family regulator
MRIPELSALDLNLLVALEALLDAGSVSGAARRLHRSQPATSRMLARLREMMGDALLVPQGRGLVMTDRARALHGPVKLLLSDARQLLHPPAPFQPASQRAHFRLISSDYAQVVLLGPVMTWLAHAAPHVSLEVLPPSGDPLDALAAGRAELLFGPEALRPSWCEARRLLSDGWACVGRRDAALPSTIEDYLGREHVEVAVATAFGDPVGTALRALGRRQVRLTVPDFAGAAFIAAQSPLVATLPAPVATAAARELGLALGPVPFPIEGATVAMIWPRRLDQDPAHAWLRATVVECLRKPAAREA